MALSQTDKRFCEQYTIADVRTMAERESSLSEGARQVLAALRGAKSEYEDHYSDYTIWQGVFLENAKIAGMPPHSWAGYLSALEAVELYSPDGNPDFGQVMIGEEE